MTYAVSRAWTTDLEPGTWYEIVQADRPQIIAGFVFMAGQADYRGVDGKPLTREELRNTAGWLAAVIAYRKQQPR